MEALEESRDGCAVTTKIGQLGGGSEEMAARVPVAEASDEVFASQEGGEEAEVVLASGVEPPVTSAVVAQRWAKD